MREGDGPGHRSVWAGSIGLRAADTTMTDARSALDLLSEGFGIFDRDLKLVESNSRLGEFLGCPPELCRPGMPIVDLYRFHAERGDYGAGDPATLADARLRQARTFAAQEFVRVLADQ